MQLKIGKEKVINTKIKSISYGIGNIDDSELGQNYPVVGGFEEDIFKELLLTYEDKDIYFSLFDNIFYSYFEKDSICFSFNFPKDYIDKIIQDNRIVFVITKNNIDYLMYYDKIMT